MATKQAMADASSRSFFANHPAALANCRSFHGLTERTGRPASSKAAMTPRSYPPLGSMPIARAPIGRSRRHNSTPAGAVVADAEPRFSWIQRDIQPLFGNIDSHRRGLSCAIFLSLPCGAGLTHATVRDCEERRPGHLAHPRFAGTLGRDGLQAAPGIGIPPRSIPWQLHAARLARHKVGLMPPCQPAITRRRSMGSPVDNRDQHPPYAPTSA